jgi:hypothetical protein
VKVLYHSHTLASNTMMRWTLHLLRTEQASTTVAACHMDLRRPGSSSACYKVYSSLWKLKIL